MSGPFTNTEANTALDEQINNTTCTSKGWDDIPTPLVSIKLPPSSAPEEVLWDHGITSGVTFPTLGFDVGEYAYAVIQSPHRMELNTIIDQHIHYSVPSDGTGKTFNFQVDVIAACVDCDWAVPTGSPFTAEKTMAADLSGKHSLFDLMDIPAINDTVSTLYKLKITRIASSVPANEYAGQVYLDFFDGHYKSDQDRGSREEYVK